jgi:ABC-type Fe3+/spermidine/putrescine transport system ATPase subunit
VFVADFVGASNRTEATVAEVLADGRYRLSAGAAHGIEAVGPPGLTAGAAVSLIVRPEQVRLGGDGFAAVVADVSFVGPAKHLELDSDELGRLRATVGGDVPATAGDRVSLSWPAEAAWIVP